MFDGIYFNSNGHNFNNISESALSRGGEYIVVKLVNGGWWYEGCYSSDEADEVATQLINCGLDPWVLKTETMAEYAGMA